ncbi:MAG TPA: TetR/AcrR family transcriptional regulator [Acidimicrobiales bacterium]|nr:TetR/AcrR family transcriptional regulator [Acidimicrobiales bacterium]
MSEARTSTAAVRRRTPARSRREVILEAAVNLFRERGFHSTGIDDIGAVAGISGPAVYRHFANKDDILITAFARTWERMMEGVAVARTMEPAEAVETLMRSHLTVCIEHRSLISLWTFEQRHLPPNYRREARRQQDGYVGAWIGYLNALRPELSREEAKLAVHAALGVYQCIIVFEYDVEREKLEAFVLNAVRATLFGDLSPPRKRTRR